MQSGDQVGWCAGRQLRMCVGVHAQAGEHADIGACMLGFLGCWVARSPGFLGSWVAMVTLDSWVAGLLGLLGSWVAMALVHVCGGACASKRACRHWCMHAWVPGLLGC